MESRKLLIQQACIELDARGYTLDQIAGSIFERFQMENRLTYSSISQILKAARKSLMDDIKEVQMILRQSAFDELEPLRRKYLKIASAEAICIEREKVIDGEKQKYIDEDAFDKQTDALNGYLKIMAQQAALLGLNLKPEDHEQGEGNTADSVKIWIINNLNQITASGVPIGSNKPGFPMIELSGGKEIDELDERPKED